MFLAGEDNEALTQERDKMKNYFLHTAPVGIVLFTLVISNLSFLKGANTQMQPVKVREAYKKQDMDRIIKEANEYLQSDPKNAEVLLMLSEAYINKGYFILGETSAKKAVTIEPGNAWGWRVIGRAHREMAQVSKSHVEINRLVALAQSELDKSVSINDKDAWVFVEMSYLYKFQNNAQKTLEMISKAVKISPEDETIKKVARQFKAIP